jgi:hypothetical protein
MTPEAEQQLADVSHGYEEAKVIYNSLLQKQNQSQLATKLQQRQQGEQFRIIDPPSLPDKPSSPNHFIGTEGSFGIRAYRLLRSILLGLNAIVIGKQISKKDTTPCFDS